MNDYFDDAVAWYKRLSVWAAGGVGFAAGVVVTWLI